MILTTLAQLTGVVFVRQTGKGLAERPPFSLSDLKDSIPAHCWQKDTARSLLFLARDVAVVVGLAAGAYTINQWYVHHPLGSTLEEFFSGLISFRHQDPLLRA